MLGVIGGAAIIAGAIYLAVRPYLKRDFMPGDRPWMPDPSGRDRTDDPDTPSWRRHPAAPTGHTGGHL